MCGLACVVRGVAVVSGVTRVATRTPDRPARCRRPMAKRVCLSCGVDFILLPDVFSRDTFTYNYAYCAWHRHSPSGVAALPQTPQRGATSGAAPPLATAGGAVTASCARTAPPGSSGSARRTRGHARRGKARSRSQMFMPHFSPRATGSPACSVRSSGVPWRSRLYQTRAPPARGWKDCCSCGKAVRPPASGSCR